MRDADALWLMLGVAGQLAFSARFVLQWLYSERRGESAVPMSFWYASVSGAVVLLAYAIHRRDPVFMAGQSCGLLVYARNIQLRLRESRHDATSEAT
jgi:lipid-A-disaccharide synthase-like uncharacterized protein